MGTFGGRVPTYADFVQAVRAYAPSHLIQFLARYAADRGGWDVELRPGMRPPWAVAAMVRDCIVSGNESRSGQLSEARLRRLFNIFGEAHDERGDTAQAILTPIIYEQFPYQQSDYEELLRSIALFEDPYPGCRNWPWDELLGSSVTDLISLAFLVHTVVMNKRGEYKVTPAFQQVVDMLEYTDQLPKMVDGLTRTVPQLKTASKEVSSGDPANRRFSYNPLVRTPLVETADGLFAPVPELIYSSVSPSVLYHRARDAWGDAFSRDLGQRVQQYVGRQLQLLSPDLTILPEIEYRKGQLSADWFAVNDDLLLVVECKASRASLEARLGSQALDDQFKRDISKAKGQIERTASLVAAGDSALSQMLGRRQVIGLIVTAEPFYLLAQAHSSELIAGIPTLLGSLRDLEHWTTLPAGEAVRQLTSIATDPERRTWPLGNALDVPPNSTTHNSILESVWERLPLAKRRAGDLFTNGPSL
ncbi:MAG: hypothetical protein P0Y48_10895 [Candidatus Microbacterium phytovorans]|uniref:Uncharacterized protein n=1 Tax=Candidatus Microbacterium phytovorans TaxID=3121374 RepID=A0AAJ6B2K5_9MICO|nr:hypothetical protein [Microbacterium sp.]WEK12965.1 MAG: hypothetical protein P0Y48_10895 [Microbacterium sp.]